ncbi:MAG TPA: carboxypeptidase-like regulatory domain-containing protein [Burkholderiales bacterium]|nr:carboxypeptidase-like regulatory domain-containing protein [Burkholderiales bacterium]
MKIAVIAAAAFTAALAVSNSFAADKLKLSRAVTTKAHEIGGIVSGAKGPEAGVWVIAQTHDTPTQLTKIVVTDDKGRYLIPDLPDGKYSVWVRGYGLVDSPKVEAEPGKTLDLKAVAAPSEKEAAEYYPAIYWFSLLRVPQANEFPLGPVPTQGAWLNTIKSGACQSCHALGTPWMRKVPDVFLQKHNGNSVEAWRERVQSGGARALMARDISRLDGERALKNFAQWTDDIAKGELPFAKPERPKGIERNVVVTLWDWGHPTGYLHDEVSTDRRNPRVNANGKIYGSPEDSSDLVPVLDPTTNSATEILHPVRSPETPSVQSAPFGPSAVWGDKPIWDGHTINHNPMMDEKGRVWFTSRVEPDKNPDWCKDPATSASTRAFPLDGNANRHLGMLDPSTGKWTLIRTCFPTHHLNFARDANDTLWLSPGVVGPGVMGWLNVRLYEQSGDEKISQGWTPLVLDTNGNGKRDEYVAADAPVDPSKDKRIVSNLYAINVSPKDGSVWGTAIGYPGQIVRFVPGPDPVHTGLAEVYEPPLPGFGPRGGDVDTNGVYWVSLASGHLGKFDRSKCKVLNGPSATGKHCPEGWTLYKLPGPQLRDVKTPGSAEASYYTWIDWNGILGLGKNVPIVMANLSDAIYAFKDGKFIRFIVPYPSGWFPKNVDGRIDDPGAGWKGRAIWSTTGTRALFHTEMGKEGRHKAIKFQLRPNPLAD